MLNTFFGLLVDEPPAVADNFIKDRCDWLTFNRLAIKAARKNPELLLWIWELAGPRDLIRWLGNYFNFGRSALVSAVLSGWFPRFLEKIGTWLEPRYPAFWLKLLTINYAITTGKPRSPTQVAQLNPKELIPNNLG